jgi:hypothetical protein
MGYGGVKKQGAAGVDQEANLPFLQRQCYMSELKWSDSPC